MISLILENSRYLFADDSTFCCEISHPSDKHTGSSIFTLLSQTGQTLGTCLSNLRNPSLTHSLPKDHTANPSIYFLNTLSKRFSDSKSWISLSAMISLGQATFQNYPPKPGAGRVCGSGHISIFHRSGHPPSCKILPWHN